jgi:hypothetical protein
MKNYYKKLEPKRYPYSCSAVIKEGSAYKRCGKPTQFIQQYMDLRYPICEECYGRLYEKEKV